MLGNPLSKTCYILMVCGIGIDKTISTDLLCDCSMRTQPARNGMMVNFAIVRSLGISSI